MIRPVSNVAPTFKAILRDSVLHYSDSQEIAIERNSKILNRPQEDGISLCDKYEKQGSHFLFEPNDDYDTVDMYLFECGQEPLKNGSQEASTIGTKLYVGSYDKHCHVKAEDLYKFDNTFLKNAYKSVTELVLTALGIGLATMLTLLCIQKCSNLNKVADSSKPLIENVTNVVKH